MPGPWFFAVDHLSTDSGSAVQAVGEGALSTVRANCTIETEAGLSNRKVIAGVSGDPHPFAKLFTSATRLVFGCRMVLTNHFSTNTYDFIRFENASGRLLAVSRDSSGNVTVRRGTDVLDTLSVGITLGVYFYIEVAVVFDESDGRVVVRIDGQEALSVSSADTANVTIGDGCNQLRWAALQTGTSGTYQIRMTDAYIREWDEEEVDPPFYGPIQLRLLRPTADVTVDWSPDSGSDNYERVEDEGGSDGDDSYVETQTIDDADEYQLDDVPPGVNSIIAVVPVTVGSAPNGGAPQVALALVNGEGDVESDPLSLGAGAYRTQMGQGLLERPGGGSWSVAAVNGINLRMTAV